MLISQCPGLDGNPGQTLQLLLRSHGVIILSYKGHDVPALVSQQTIRLAHIYAEIADVLDLSHYRVIEIVIEVAVECILFGLISIEKFSVLCHFLRRKFLF